jgi:hypothetical protein
MLPASKNFSEKSAPIPDTSSDQSSNHFLNFPEELRVQNRWVGWRKEERRDSQGKTNVTKPPVRIIDGRLANKTDPIDWSTFEAAVAAFTEGRWQLDGIGYCFAESGCFGLDLDGCRNKETGDIEPEALKIIAQFPGYWEISVSGTGVHGIGRGKKPKIAGTKVTGTWNKICDKDPAVEVHDVAYFTVSGELLPGAESDVEDWQEPLESLCSSLWPEPSQSQIEQPNKERKPSDGFKGSDEDLIKLMCSGSRKIAAAWRGDPSGYNNDRSAADYAVMSSLAFYTAKDADRMRRLFAMSPLFERHKDKLKDFERKLNINKILRETIAVYRDKVKETFGRKDVRRIREYASQKVTYQIEKFLVAGTITMIAGESGKGKSMITTAMGDCISRGAPFAGLQTHAAPVLLLDGGENPLPVVIHRLDTLKADDNPNFQIWGDWCEASPALPSVDIKEWIESCEEKPVIIIDCFSSMFTGDSENDSAQIRSFFRGLRDLTKLGATLVVLHNRGKNEAVKYRGSSAIKDCVDAMWILDSDVDERGWIKAIRFTREKQRFISEDSLASSFGFSFDNVTGEFALNQLDSQQRKSITLRDLLSKNPGVSKDRFAKLATQKSLGYNAALDFIDLGLAESSVRMEAKGSGHVYFLVEKDRTQREFGYDDYDHDATI